MMNIRQEQKAYRSKGGEILVKPSEKLLTELVLNAEGMCLKCGETFEDIEPDTRGLECEGCGARKLYSGSALLLRGIYYADGSDHLQDVAAVREGGAV